MDQNTSDLLKAYRAVMAKNPAEQKEIREMFRCHNIMFKPRENGISCQGCVNRVLRRVRAHLTTLGLI